MTIEQVDYTWALLRGWQAANRNFAQLAYLAGFGRDDDHVNDTGLDIVIMEGNIIKGSDPVNIAETTLTLFDDTDNYVELDVANEEVIAVEDAFTPGNKPLYVITTVAGEVTVVEDKRSVWIFGYQSGHSTMGLYTEIGPIVTDQDEYNLPVPAGPAEYIIAGGSLVLTRYHADLNPDGDYTRTNVGGVPQIVFRPGKRPADDTSILASVSNHPEGVLSAASAMSTFELIGTGDTSETDFELNLNGSYEYIFLDDAGTWSLAIKGVDYERVLILGSPYVRFDTAPDTGVKIYASVSIAELASTDAETLNSVAGVRYDDDDLGTVNLGERYVPTDPATGKLPESVIPTTDLSALETRMDDAETAIDSLEDDVAILNDIVRAGVADITALMALPSGPLPEMIACYVVSKKSHYFWNDTSATADDGNLYIKPDDIPSGNGRWHKQSAGIADQASTISSSSVTTTVFSDLDQDSATTTGLGYGGVNRWGYKTGKVVRGNALLTTVAAGYVTLTSNTTNYVEVDHAGTVTTNTTGFTDGKLPIRRVVTDGSGNISHPTTDARTVFQVPTVGRTEFLALQTDIEMGLFNSFLIR